MLVKPKGAIILTSNKSFGEWGDIFSDHVLATAILDRLLHFSTTVNIRGHSYRLREMRKAGVFHDLTQDPQEVPTHSGEDYPGVDSQSVARQKSLPRRECQGPMQRPRASRQTPPSAFGLVLSWEYYAPDKHSAASSSSGK